MFKGELSKRRRWAVGAWVTSARGNPHRELRGYLVRLPATGRRFRSTSSGCGTGSPSRGRGTRPRPGRGWPPMMRCWRTCRGELRGVRRRRIGSLCKAGFGLITTWKACWRVAVSLTKRWWGFYVLSLWQQTGLLPIFGFGNSGNNRQQNSCCRCNPQETANSFLVRNPRQQHGNKRPKVSVVLATAATGIYSIPVAVAGAPLG